MLNWIHELETLQPELEKEKTISLSDQRIRTLQRLCKRPLYQVAMIALYCALRKGNKTVRSREFLEAAHVALPGKPALRGLEALMAANWMRGFSDGVHSNDEILRLTRPIEQALERSDFCQLPGIPADVHHAELLRLHARACSFRRGNDTLREWHLCCDRAFKRMSLDARKAIAQSGMSIADRNILLYVGVTCLMEGGDLDLRAVLHLFASDPIERTLLRAQLLSPEYPLAKGHWWKMEESFRGDMMLKVSTKFQKCLLPELDVQTVERINPALQRIACDSIQPMELFYDSMLRKELTTLEQLCNVNVFEQYKQAQTGTAMKGIAIQLHGGPGTGKTEFCYQLARRTGRNLLLLDVSQARDKYYGETEKMITGIFRDYEKQVGEGGAFPILFFNEGDSIFQRRIDSDQNSSHTDNTVQTILLNELERFQGILLVTTNTPKHFDKAFERRFQFRLQFNAPGEQTRLQLLRNALPEGKLPVLQRIACECQFTAAELQNALRRLHIEGLCGITTLDRAAAIWDMLRSDKIEKQRIGFRV
jgi:hypothetical protein